MPSVQWGKQNICSLSRISSNLLVDIQLCLLLTGCEASACDRFHCAKVIFLSPFITFCFHVLPTHPSLGRAQHMDLLWAGTSSKGSLIYREFQIDWAYPKHSQSSQTGPHCSLLPPALFRLFQCLRVILFPLLSPSKAHLSSKTLGLISDLKNCKAERQLMQLRL